jgi:hypothetical protein
MKYEIINPSDKCFLIAKSHAAAMTAVAIIGEGAYGVTCLDAEFNSGLGLFGDFPESAYKAAGIDPPNAATMMNRLEEIQEWNDEVAEVLKSVHLSGARSSLNDIVRHAHRYAEALLGRKKFSSVDADNPVIS